MTDRLSGTYDQIIGIILEKSGELAAEKDITDEVAALEQRIELIERAEDGMIGEDGQPLPEWEWYFEALAEEEA